VVFPCGKDAKRVDVRAFFGFVVCLFAASALMVCFFQFVFFVTHCAQNARHNVRGASFVQIHSLVVVCFSCCSLSVCICHFVIVICFLVCLLAFILFAVMFVMSLIVLQLSEAAIELSAAEAPR
jgi:tellurite resistance protein TehA-like permease